MPQTPCAIECCATPGQSLAADQVSGERASRPPRNPRRSLAVVVVLAHATFVLGVTLGHGLGSERREARRRRPQAPSTITASAEERKLTEVVIARGTVGYAGRVDIPAPDLAGEGDDAVITAVNVRTGADVIGGQALIEVAGRPLIALPGEAAMYRDLEPGDTGTDVAQFQQALAAAGRLTGGDPLGTYGPATQQSVADLYRTDGFASPGPSAAAVQRRDAANTRLTVANEALDQAWASPDAPSQAAVVPAARREVAAARQEVTAATAEMGTVVRRREIVLVHSLPAVAVKVNARVGLAIAGLKGPAVSLASGGLIVRAAITQADAEQVHAGLPVKLTAEALGTDAKGTVTAVTNPGTANPTGDPSRSQLTAQLDRTSPANLVGQDVRVEIVVRHSGASALVVPVVAVATNAAGRSVVEVVRGGRVHTIEVRPGLVSAGSVAVEPVVQGSLRGGDLVVVGG